MDTNKLIAKALLNKSFSEAKELVFKSLYAKSSLALDEARYDVANSVFNEAKKSPATSVPAGASEDKFKAARDTVKKAGYKAKLGKGVPAGAMKEEAELDEMAQTAERKKETDREEEKLTGTLAKRSKTWREHPDKGSSGERDAEHEFDKARDARWKSQETADMEKTSKDLYGKGGKIIKKNKDNLLKKRPTYGGKAVKK